MPATSTDTYFDFSHRPFRGTPDPQDYVALDTVEQEIQRLTEAVIQGDGIGVLTAAPGAGKTLVCERLRAELSPRFHAVVLSSSGFATRRSLLQAILFALGQSYGSLSEQELRLDVLNYARSIAAEQDAIVLIIDEAHLLNARLLEELRCLTNHSAGGQTLIRVVLCGQLPLEEALVEPALQALNYRITCHAALEPLSMQESAALIAGRLLHVGRTVEGIFSADALETICRVSDGNPRCLIQLCDQSLTLAAGHAESPVEAETVRIALSQLKQLPLQWNESSIDQPSGTGESEMTFDSDDEATESIEESRNDNHVSTPEWSTDIASIEVGSASDEEAGVLINEQIENEQNVETVQTSSWSSFEPESVVPSESRDVSDASTAGDAPIDSVDVTETLPSEEPNSPVSVSLEVTPSGNIVELDVDDRYAVLDQQSGRSLTVADSASLIDALRPLVMAKPKRPGNPPVAITPEATIASAEAPTSHDILENIETRLANPHVGVEQRVDDVIKAISVAAGLPDIDDDSVYDAVAPDVAWQSAGNTDFDLVSPDWCEEPVVDAIPPERRSASTEAVPQIGERKVDRKQAKHRPYARLFSRMRRQRA